jgi:hypothetical protein
MKIGRFKPGTFPTAHDEGWRKKTMTRIGRTKAIAGALAMIADAFPESTPRESDELLWESAVEFCAAMDRYAWFRSRGRWGAWSFVATPSCSISTHRCIRLLIGFALSRVRMRGSNVNLIPLAKRPTEPELVQRISLNPHREWMNFFHVCIMGR